MSEEPTPSVVSPSDPVAPPNALTDSALGRLVGALVSPVKTFQSIGRRPTWVAAFLLLLVTSGVSTSLAWQKVDFETAMRDQLAKQGKELSDEDVARFSAMQGRYGLGCAIAAAPVAWLVAALVLMVIFKLLGGEIGFARSWSVTLHSMLPWAVAALLAIPVVLARSEIDLKTLQGGGVLASHLGAFAPADASPLLLAALSSLDLFSLWTAVLLAIGFSVVAGVSRAAAAGTVIALWVVWVVVKVGLAALGAMSGGG